jgi:hypothetical protein
MSAFDRLITQIDAFIRKFYKNQVIKGFLLFTGVLVLSYLFVITLEFFGHFGSYVRGILLFSFIGINIFILSKFIVVPTLRLRAFGNRIDRYQASKIIGKFFPKISDRLLNTLQLSDQMDQNSADFELLNASVQQRSASMSVVPFAEAIDLGENRKHLNWVLPVVLILFAIGVFSPSLLTQGTERVVNFTEVYETPPPFNFSLLTSNDSIEEGEDYKFEVELVGDNLPTKVYIKSKQGRFLLSRTAKNKFNGRLEQVRENMSFSFESSFEGEPVNSEEYAINVISKTAIGKLQATLIYPSYLGKEKEVIQNASDLTVQEGTRIVWSVLAKNTDGAEFWLNEKKNTFSKEGFSLSEKFTQDAKGKIVLKNVQSGKRDTTFFNIDVIKDLFPTIEVNEVMDTVRDGTRYFSGKVGDDYGLRSLNFVYRIEKKNGESRTETVKVGKVFGTTSPFDFAVDFRREELDLNDKIEYYFIVSDNDGVNGSKTSKSRTFEYRLPSLEELNESRAEDQEKTKDDLKELLDQAKKFEEDVERLRKEALNSKQASWNKQNQVNQLQEDHKSLLENLKNLQEEMKNSIEEKNQLSEVDEKLLEQQEMINDLLEELMDDELRDLLDQLEELMNEQNKDAIEENMEQLEMSSEEMKNQLDRSLEMLKKLQVDEKIDDIEEELKELAKEQDELREDTEGKKDIDASDVEKQEEINEAFEKIKDDLRELDSLNKELKRPMELGDQEEKSDEIKEDLNESKDQLQKDKGKKAGESQEGASEGMKEMAESLDAAQAESNQEQQQEDIDALREILESLVMLSFEQEDVLNRFEDVIDTDPAYRKYGRNQRKIIDDTRIVRDSLLALAERQPKIAQFVDQELNQIKVNHKLILEDIDEHRRPQLLAHQQYVMTSYNNLALLLNEALQQMQQQMQQMKPGSGSCNKPGGKGKPKPGEGSPGDMKEMLKQQLEQMKKGKSPGGKKPGDAPGSKPGGQKPGMGLGTKEVAKMAAQQSAIRKRLEELRNEMNKDGKGSGNELNPLIQELEQQERDLINKRLGDNLIERQQRILTRLLESEKALIERGLDEKRESKEGKSENNSNHIRFEEYNKEKLKQIELLRSVDPAYRKYYKDRANEYFNRAL